MPEVKNLDSFTLFVNLIVDSYWAMQETSNFRTLLNNDSQMRKRCEDLAVIEKAFAKSGRGLWIIGADIVQNLFKVLQGCLGDDDFECH